MISIFDAILLKYPGIQGVTYWETQYDGEPWNDPYDGLVWENIDIQKPSASDIAQWQTDPAIIATNTAKQNTIANAPILAQLDSIDLKSVRALRTNDTQRLAELENQAAALRAQLLLPMA